MISEADSYFSNMIKPKILDNSPQNEIIKQIVDFEMLCVNLMRNGILEPDKMSVLRFYSTLQVFEKEKTSRRNGQDLQ